MGYNVTIIHDAELNWVDRLLEPKRPFVLPANVQQFCGYFLPFFLLLHF